MRWILSIIALVSMAAIADQVQIEKAITGINPIIQIESVKPVDDTPFFEVTLKTGERIYTDAKGSHFVAGDLYQVGSVGVKISQTLVVALIVRNCSLYLTSRNS